MKKQLIIATAISALLATTNLVSAQRGPDNPSGGGMSATPSAPATPAQPAEKMAPSGGKADSGPRAGGASDQRASESRSNGMNRADDSSKPTGSSAQQGSPQNQSPSQAQSSGSSTERNGSGGARANANLSTEQRTRIRETVVKESNAPRITRNEVNFNLTVGTVVPRTVRVATLPAAVISIHPAWRGYSYVLVGDEIVILEPGTLRIIAIIPA